jgi:hypothetical protein
MIVAVRNFIEICYEINVFRPTDLKIQNLKHYDIFGYFRVEVEVTLRLTVSQSVSQYVLVSSTLVGLEISISRSNRLENKSQTFYLNFLTNAEMAFHGLSTVFARSNTAIVGSNPTEAWMFVCVLCAFFLCLHSLR